MHISVIGTGYVGLVTGACFAEFGVDVTCMDRDENRIATLEKGKVPFYEPGLAELVTKNFQAGRLKFTTDLHKAVDDGTVDLVTTTLYPVMRLPTFRATSSTNERSADPSG